MTIKKNKIIFLTHWFPNEENPFFGIFIKKHAEALSLRNDVTVVNFDIKRSNKVLKISLIENDNKSYTIKIESLFYKLLYYTLPFHLFLFKRLIKKYKINISTFDYIFSNIIFPNGIITSKIAEKYKIKHIHIEHWSRLNRFFTKDIYRKKGLNALKKCSDIICVSNLLKDQLNKHISNKISIIPNVVDQVVFKQKLKEIKNEKIIFISVANWQKPKNPFPFLEALEIVNKDFKDIELKMIGSGPLLEQVKEKKYSYKITYKGVLNSVDIANELCTSNFLLHGSDYETFSVIIVEALSTGTPVLVSDVGISKEVVNIDNGYICKNNTKDWSEKIKLAIRTSYNPSIISNSVKNKFDISTIALKFQEVLEKSN